VFVAIDRQAGACYQFISESEPFKMPTRAQLEELLQSDPEDTFLLYAHAKACVTEGDVETALQQFDEVLKRDAKHVATYFQKGQVLAEQARNAEAVAVITQGIAVAREVRNDHAESEMRGFLETLE
jgi:predicted Zn-dependent protease